MKVMKNTMKCLVAVFVMAMVFAVSGITAEAMEATYVPANRTDLTKQSTAAYRDYSVPANSAIVIPVKVAGKGGLNMYYIAQDSATTPYYEDIYANFYSDPACTASISGAYIGFVGSVGDGKVIGFQGAGTIYMLVENDSDENLVFRFAAEFISGANRKIKSGGSTAIYQNDYSKWVYTEFKATKTGYIAVTAQDYDGYSITVKLHNSSKKVLSEDQYVKNGVTYFGVQKNKKYYIATKTSADLYNIKVKQTKISDKSGSKKSKAKTMSRKKNYKGVLIANKKKSGDDWYKIKLTSKRKLKLTIKGGATGSWIYDDETYSSDIYVEIIPANKRQTLRGAYTYVVNGTTYLESEGKLSAGTYYVQIRKRNNLSSGWYSIKWQ